jgi:hypothetical protein
VAVTTAPAKKGSAAGLIIALLVGLLVLGLVGALGYWVWSRSRRPQGGGSQGNQGSQGSQGSQGGQGTQGPISGYRLYPDSNVICDIPSGCDIGTNVRTETAAQCAARCTASPQCQGFLYYQPGLGPDGDNCWIKRFNSRTPAIEPWKGAEYYARLP